MSANSDTLKEFRARTGRNPLMVPALVGSLCVWIMCGDPLLAQVTETPQTVPLRQPGESATAPCLPLDAELCEPAAEPAGCFSTEADYLVRWFKPVCLNVPVISVGNPSA